MTIASTNLKQLWVVRAAYLAASRALRAGTAVLLLLSQLGCSTLPQIIPGLAGDQPAQAAVPSGRGPAVPEVFPPNPATSSAAMTRSPWESDPTQNTYAGVSSRLAGDQPAQAAALGAASVAPHRSPWEADPTQNTYGAPSPGTQGHGSQSSRSAMIVPLIAGVVAVIAFKNFAGAMHTLKTFPNWPAVATRVPFIP